jgi:hypothetical protein
MLSLSLSALVLAWGTVPPGIQHAHAGGSNAAHRHDNRHEVAHHGSHQHNGDDEHHEHANLPGVSPLADYILHVHWRLLGVDFCMPMSEKPVGDNGDEGTIPPAIVCTANEVVPATQVGPSIGCVLLTVVCTPSADVVRSLEPIPRPPYLVTSIPLCDSARLERSGVLLA